MAGSTTKRASRRTGARSPATSGAPQASKDLMLDMHRRMVRIRLFEEEAGRLTEASKVPGFLHLYVGEEAVAAGVMTALTDDDQITSTHRGHGHIVAKGGDLRMMFAELYGKATGYCKGKGGSMHISDLDLGVLGANGIVGGGIPIAVGAAFANAYRADGRVTAAFFGDGASNIGSFHEAANMAATLALPVVFVCENNLYGEFTGQDRHQAVKDVADRAAGYGMPGVVVDGMDVLAVHAATVEAVDRARAGGGPSMIEAKTYRYYDHQGVKGLRIPYRSEDEVAEWRARDAVTSFESVLVKKRHLSRAAVQEVWDEIAGEIADAVAFAEESPVPTVDELLTDVYTDEIGATSGALR